MRDRAGNLLLTTLLGLIAAVPAAAVVDHPVITEVFTDPPGLNDGPIGRDPSNLHQEFIEIYLPPLADLDPALNKDSLDLTLYDVEGDFTSATRGLVNHRIDLPTFDLDPSNGLTGLPRPPNGTVVIGWVDYNAGGTDLAGTPATRVALINGGVTSTSEFTFIALNGNEFGGTTNFPTPLEFSHIEAIERSAGIFENGSSAHLLVNRDDPGYAVLYDDDDPCCVNSDPDLPSGTVLQTSCLLDAFASNDDGLFVITEQPYSPPTGDQIDFENDLPAGGAFSMMVPQLPEIDFEQGYAMWLGDIGKTTDDANPANDDPVADALFAYRTINPLGPFYASPGLAPVSTTPAELSLADASLQQIEILAGTFSRPAVIAANVGGAYLTRTTANPGAPTVPGVVDVGAGPFISTTEGAIPLFPTWELEADITVPDGSSTVVPVQVTATKIFGADPQVVNRQQTVDVTVTVSNPTTGIDAAQNPYEATAFVAIQGLPAPAVGTNEFEQTSLGLFVKTNLGGEVLDDRGNGAALIDPNTNLGDPLVIDAMEQGMPDSEIFYINPSSGVSNLVTEVFLSPERMSGAGTYEDGTFNGGFTAVRAIDLGIPDVSTSGGVFAPTESVHFTDSVGRAGDPASGLSNVTTMQRGFELALVDSNVLSNGLLESGESDDFGLVVEIGSVRPGASVVPGEYVFLSLSGGLSGADVDTLDVPPFNNRTTIIYVDLDPLDTELGALSVSRLFVIDSGGTGSVNIIEAFTLAADGVDVPAAQAPFGALGALLLGAAGVTRLRLRCARG